MMPFHPLVVHFPIALLLTATIVEIVNLFLKRQNLSLMGTILLIVGVISGFVSTAACNVSRTIATSWLGLIR